MWQKLVLVIGLMLATSITASGQAIQLFGGYSYQRFDGTPVPAAINLFSGGSPLGPGSVHLNGWEVAGRVRLISWLGGVADVAGHYGSPLMQTTAFTVGPEINLPTRISPFFHVLVGGARIRAGAYTDTAVATVIGGGVDLRLIPFVSWRLIQADAVRTRFFGGTQHNTRISTGIVLRF